MYIYIYIYTVYSTCTHDMHMLRRAHLLPDEPRVQDVIAQEGQQLQLRLPTQHPNLLAMKAKQRRFGSSIIPTARVTKQTDI